MLKAVDLKHISVCIVLAGAVVGAEPVKLQYGRVDGETFVTTSSITRNSTIGDQGPKTDVNETKSRVVAHRSEDGYENSVTILSTKFEREGHSIASPLFAAMEDLELTYRLAPDGKLREIAGYEKLVDALKAKFPPAISQTMAPLLNYHSIRLRDEAEYRERYEGYIGTPYTPGTTQVSAKAHALPYGGTILLYVVTEVGELSDCGENRCLTLTQTYNSDPQKLAAAVDTFDIETLQAAATGVEAALPKNHMLASVEGSGEIVLEPNTLFLVSRKSSDDVEIVISQLEKDPLKISMNELREFTSEREAKAASE